MIINIIDCLQNNTVTRVNRLSGLRHSSRFLFLCVCVCVYVSERGRGGGRGSIFDLHLQPSLWPYEIAKRKEKQIRLPSAGAGGRGIHRRRNFP